MRKKFKKFMSRALMILLVAIFILPTAALSVQPPTVALNEEPPPQETEIQGLVVPVALNQGSVGITPDELDAMAIDPQSWQLPSLQTWEDDFTRNPVVDWDGYRSTRPDLSESREFRGALILIEFPDRPLMTRGPQGFGLMGNPQVAVDATACPADTCNTVSGVGCDACVAQFWDDFFNTPYTELNSSITIGGYWLENSFGNWNIELDIYGPFMMPMFEFQFPSNGSFWNRNEVPTGGIFGGRYDFGNFHFGNQFPMWGRGTGNLGDANAASAFPIENSGGMMVSTNSITATAVRAAMEQDPAFIENFLDDDGNLLYEFIFITGAGYAQTATWQEMGSMMFPVGFGGNVDRNYSDFSLIAATTEIVHPVTREVMPGMTGMDFTGYARVRNIHETVTAPGFDLAAAWPNFYMLDYEAMWRAHVTTNFNNPTATGDRALTAAFIAARNAYEATNLATAFAAFNAENPEANLTQIQFRDNIFRPQFIVNYAMLRKLVTPEEVFEEEYDEEEYDYEYAYVDEYEYDDFIEYADDDIYYWSIQFEDGGYHIDVSSDYYHIAAMEDLMLFDEAWAGVSPFEALNADVAPLNFNQDWLDFYEKWSDPDWVHEELISLLEDAMYAARTSEVNPYFAAVPSRYVTWSSWYGTAGTWSHANSGFNVIDPNGVIRNLPVSAQSESTGMSTYSHELGHLVGLPDNDNSPYAAIPRRSLQGAWDIMARGTFVGPGGGHTRWMVPATMGAAVGAHQNLRGKIANGFTDLTVASRDNISNVANPTGRPVNWVRNDHQNSLDIKYVPYTQFRQSGPVVAEVFGRNIPMNQGFLDYYNNPIEGHVGIVIQGPEFNNRTPAVAANWATNLLPGGATLWDGRVLDENGYDPRTGFRRIDPARWNYMRTDAATNMGIGLTNIGAETTFTVGGETRTFGTEGGIPLTGRQHGFTVEVVDRTGYDSFMHDHGVFINRITHTNAPRSGGMENPASFIVDAHPGPLDIVQFVEADGSYYMKADCHYVNMVTATFHAGLHNNPYYLRYEFEEAFRADDPRPGVAGQTVNEWVDVHNEFHFYILARNDNRGPYGTFLSYEVGVRNTAPNAYQVGGGLVLETVGMPSVASPGNFSRQTFRITHTGANVVSTDIIRITLEGSLAAPVMRTTPGGYEYVAHTRDQNVVVLNNLYAIEPNEVIYFDAFIRVPDGQQGHFDTTGILEVVVTSETTPGKTARVESGVIDVPVFSLDIFNNGEGGSPSRPNASLYQAGFIRMWTQLDGVGTPVPYPNMTITAEFPDGTSAMQFVRVNRAWVEGQGWQDHFTSIDVLKGNGEWQFINFSITAFGQTVDLLLVNNRFVPPPELSFDIFNNGEGGSPSRPNASLYQAGFIRMWTQLDGVGTPVPYPNMTITA
jgi:hypothetical protein